MKLFRGLSKSDYQDVLRAIGHYLDERGYTNVRLIEVDDGLLVQAVPAGATRATSGYSTLHITDGQIEQLLRVAYARRRTAAAGRRPVGRGATGLTGLLPAVGFTDAPVVEGTDDPASRPSDV